MSIAGASFPPVLQGARLQLRPPRAGDVAARLAVLQDPGLLSMAYGVALPAPAALPRERAENWLARLSVEYGWVIECEGRAIGSALLTDVDPTDARARLAIGLFDPEMIGKGLGREAVSLMLGHAFGAMELHRVSLRVLARNIRAIRCYSACGFREEGRERQSARVSEGWEDDVIMGILASEFAGRA